ncbi:hypothetical protein JCM8097_000380 [Rhodosporidiobolus ruineniae]
MAEHTDTATLSYLSTLPLVLAPLPTLSSSSSKTRFCHQPPPPPLALDTKCTACRAELVGGVNASYWADRGGLWATCGGCGCTTSRREAAGTAGGTDKAASRDTTSGKAQFERVKKRRRLEEKRKAASASTSNPPSLSASPLPSARSSAAASARPSPSPAPTPSSFAAGDSAAKKRKKKPSGLAEMLEAKKKREKEASAGGGLMDFLQGL